MVAVPPDKIGPKLADVPGEATELRLTITRSGGTLWCSVFAITRAPRGGYDVFHNVDRWAADDPQPYGRLTLPLVHEVLVEAVFQRRLPGID